MKFKCIVCSEYKNKEEFQICDDCLNYETGEEMMLSKTELLDEVYEDDEKRMLTKSELMYEDLLGSKIKICEKILGLDKSKENDEVK